MIADEPISRGPGQPPHQPTDEQRAQVKALAAVGITQPEIARYIGIHDQTLRLHYRDELDLGVIEANAAVAKMLHRQAVKEGNTTAAIFWAKCRMGWKETSRVEVDDVGSKEARDAALRAALKADS